MKHFTKNPIDKKCFDLIGLNVRSHVRFDQIEKLFEIILCSESFISHLGLIIIFMSVQRKKV